MRNHVAIFLIIALLALTACDGSDGPITPPDDFERMTATVQGTDGAPLVDLSVRVEGRDTGVRTNASGQFTLDRSAFPNGVTSANELSLGRNGIVLGNRDVVPVSDRDLILKFGDNFGLTNPDNPVVPPDPAGDPGSLAGNVFDETTGALLDGVELTVFSPHGELLMGVTDNGRYSFDNLSPGEWSLTAFKDGYQPESAAINIPEGAAVVQHMSMVPHGQVSPGDGLLVTGTVRDTGTGEPVAGAIVSVMVDTGYMGMPEPGIYDDMEDMATGGPVPGVSESSGQSEPGWDPDEAPAPQDASMMPWIYEPQFFEVATDSAGRFELDEEVIGYSLWFDVRAENYLNGSQYEYIEGRTGTFDVDLVIDPFVPTSFSGTVADEDGLPIDGAYVEFVFAGDMAYPLDYALPGVMEMDVMSDTATRNFEDFDVPPPPMAPGSDSGSNGDWDDWAEASPAMGGDNAGAYQSGSGVDNPEMMRFRWENRQDGHGTSDADYFTGFYATNADAQGNYSFEGIAAGTYYVFASAYRHLPYNDMVEAAETGGNTLNIVLPNQPVGTVNGVITDDNGNPVPDALVNATQPNVDPFTYTDAAGHYTIENVPVGTWLISAYKQGYLTRSQEVEISEDNSVTVNLLIDVYEPPVYNVIAYSGHVVDGATNAGLSGCDIVFTPVSEEDGSYYQHVVSGANGAYTAALISSEYNVLLQREDYEDIFMRIWVDSEYPTMDFWMYQINSGGGWGGGWGGGPVPMMDMAESTMPERGI